MGLSYIMTPTSDWSCTYHVINAVISVVQRLEMHHAPTEVLPMLSIPAAV